MYYSVYQCGFNSACARTKREAKREAASQLLKQLSGATDLLDSSCADDESTATASDHCTDTALASCQPAKFVLKSSTFALLLKLEVQMV